MDGFNERKRCKGMYQVSNHIGYWGVRMRKVLIITVLCLLIPVMVQAEEKGKMAILPFKIHSLQPLDHLKGGLQEMFTTHMAKKGFSVISPEVVNKHPMVFLPLFELEDIFAIGKDLGANWVISGSLTQIGRKISLDLKVVDITAGKSPFSVFVVEDDIDKLDDSSNKAVVSIYNQIMGVMQVDSIQVKGNKRIETEAILAVVASKKGEGLDPDKLDKDLRAIFKMGFFKDVNIETADGPKGKIVTFNVEEKPSITRISFTGNKEIKDDDLKEELGIKLYTILNRNEIKQSINRLKEHYRQKGYYNVEIREKIEDLPRNEISLIYEIDEGEKVYITKIEFVGNDRFDDGDLKDLMETSEKGFLSWVTKSGLLDKKKLEFDLYKITSFYHNHGYIKAVVGEPAISYEKDKGLALTIEVIEGHQYGINEVKIEGDLIKPADELLKEVSIIREKFFNREVVREDTLSLKEVYTDEGYAYAEVSPVTKQDDINHLVDITYKVSKGKKVRFERIHITGNTVTRDKVIRRELKVVEGEYFNGNDLKRSTRNLYRLGFFEDLEVQTKKGSQDDLMVLDINVKERPTGSFSLGAGYSAFENAMGTFEVAQNNLFGYGQKLAAAARIGSRTTDFNLRFTEPWLFDKQLAATVKLFKWEREYDEYTKDSVGGALRFGFPLFFDEEFSKGLAQYTYDDADISNVWEESAMVLKEMEGRHVTSSITLGVARDSRDRPWNTSEGSVNSLSFEHAGGFLGGDAYFNKYEAKTAWYFPLPWKTVFLAQGRWGYAKEREGGELLIYQKYRTGGINTVRGFEFASISPVDPETGDKIGGEKMMVYNLEYRFPLITEQGVTGVVFFDAGNVFTKDESYTFSGIRRSAGAGVRWYSPVGPLRLEYGWNLDPQGDEESGNWEFSVGGMF
ncbi:MAG: outer membrane protein assembly factor BamA [Deltaproteobacteria bacterium]|nr:outer membrane protein assembly factor BamA [Deltaproteobacteria bacterium]